MALRKATSACNSACTCWRLRKSRRSTYKLTNMPDRNTKATKKKMRGTVAGLASTGSTSRYSSVPGRFMEAR
jgi:hypothetical protein